MRLKRIKTCIRCSLGSATLENIVRTGQEETSLKYCVLLPTMKIWVSDKIREPAERKENVIQLKPTANLKIDKII